MLISENYRMLNRNLHETRPDYGAGTATAQWYGIITNMAQKLKAADILDYGAGKGSLGRALSHMLVRNYDPAIPEWSDPPKPADFVVCTDVLEHIEPECLNDVLDDLQRLALRGIFLTVATAQKILSDGRNAHLIQQGAQWWLPQIMQRWDLRMFNAQPGDFVVVAVPYKTAHQEKAAE